MHGIVHKTLEEYVVDRTDEDTWETVLEQAAIEPTLYLAVSTYDDREIDAILETLAAMATQDRREIERRFGRTLAPDLLSTFDAHVPSEWRLFDLLEGLEAIVADVDAAADDVALPTVETSRESSEAVEVTYRTHRDHVYCGLAQGVLEGIVGAADANATVAERACSTDGDEACLFRVDGL